MRMQQNPEVRLLTEKFGVKKLKKIPTDLVAYITIEAESIKDANDKMMIASYCLGKIEIVEWYIELLEVGSNKYIVPHTKPYLESVRTQLLACYKKIMATPIPKQQERPLIDVQYPKGYEGWEWIQGGETLPTLYLRLVFNDIASHIIDHSLDLICDESINLNDHTVVLRHADADYLKITCLGISAHFIQPFVDLAIKSLFRSIFEKLGVYYILLVHDIGPLHYMISNA